MADPTTAVTTRVGGPGDVPAWLALFDAAVAWLVANGRAEQWGRAPLSAHPAHVARVTRWADSGQARVAEVHGRVVGALAVGPAPRYVPPTECRELYLEGFVTARDRIGEGIGSALLAAAIAEARAAGVQQIRTDCWAGGDGALVRYYERVGFRRDRLLGVGDWRGQLLVYPLT